MSLISDQVCHEEFHWENVFQVRIFHIYILYEYMYIYEIRYILFYFFSAVSYPSSPSSFSCLLFAPPIHSSSVFITKPSTKHGTSRCSKTMHLKLHLSLHTLRNAFLVLACLSLVPLFLLSVLFYFLYDFCESGLGFPYWLTTSWNLQFWLLTSWPISSFTVGGIKMPQNETYCPSFWNKIKRKSLKFKKVKKKFTATSCLFEYLLWVSNIKSLAL